LEGYKRGGKFTKKKGAGRSKIRGVDERGSPTPVRGRCTRLLVGTGRRGRDKRPLTKKKTGREQKSNNS